MRHSFRAAAQDHEVGLTTARMIMVNMPDEVFDIWLRHLIGKDGGNEGWPFTHASQRTYGTRWHKHFDGHSLQTISNLRWQRQQIPALASLFGPDSQTRLQRIADTHLRELCTPCSSPKERNGRESFARARQFIERASRLPTPAVLIKQGQGYQIMDGKHRIAALLFLSGRSNLSIDCWIGNPG